MVYGEAYGSIGLMLKAEGTLQRRMVGSIGDPLLDNKSGNISLRLALGHKTDYNAPRVQKTKVILISIDHPETVPIFWQGLAENNGDVSSATKDIDTLMLINLGAGKGEGIVARQRTGEIGEHAEVVFCVVVKWNAGETLH